MSSSTDTPGTEEGAPSQTASSPTTTSPNPDPATLLSSALLSQINPALRQATQTLVELQESQKVLVATIASKRSELLESSIEWQQSLQTLDRIPEYLEKVARIKKKQAATAALTEKLTKGTAALMAKVEEKERERAEKRGADAAGFAAVAQR